MPSFGNSLRALEVVREKRGWEESRITAPEVFQQEEKKPSSQTMIVVEISEVTVTG